SNGGTGASTLTGVLKGNTTSAVTAMTGTANWGTRWSDANTLSTGVIYDNGTNVGIGTTTVSSAKLVSDNGGVGYSIDARNSKIANVAPGTAGTEAVNYNQLSSISVHNPVTLSAIGASSNATGMTINSSTQALNLEPASASYGGIVPMAVLLQLAPNLLRATKLSPVLSPLPVIIILIGIRPIQILFIGTVAPLA
ncbi:MAG: hypothetical protein NTX66_03900, partial [Candidatus Falkowbacteria bacterium]|nr:hypothetical protein [Candidatus Falkowbacteria bacterium]